MTTNYNYTQLHEIIEAQYKVSTTTDSKKSVLDESAKLLKGYTTPYQYLSALTTETEIIKEDEPLYLDS